MCGYIYVDTYVCVHMCEYICVGTYVGKKVGKYVGEYVNVYVGKFSKITHTRLFSVLKVRRKWNVFTEI